VLFARLNYKKKAASGWGGARPSPPTLRSMFVCFWYYGVVAFVKSGDQGDAQKKKKTNRNFGGAPPGAGARPGRC